MASQLPLNGYILALDVGDKRIGSALASVVARLPQPSGDIDASDNAIGQIKQLVDRQAVKVVVVGLPRNMQGEETAQSQKIRNFAKSLKDSLSIPVEFADESLSSKRADELAKNSKLKNVSRDSLAACFILEEFLGSIDE